MTSSDTRILMVGSWEYSGSGKAMSYFAEALAACGYHIDILSFSSPHACSSHPSRYSSITVRTVRDMSLPFDNSPYISHAMVLLNDIVEWCDSNEASKYAIWGHYLYPYALVCMLATLMVQWDPDKHTCLVTPAGSDVWDRRQHLSSVLKHTFEQRPDAITLTYSSFFQKAVERAYPFIRQCGIFSPVLPDAHFHIPPQESQILAKKSLGIREDEPTIGIVCNMRPAKNIDKLSETLLGFGLENLSPTILLVGPDRGYTVPGFRTIRTGVVPDVRPYIWACDCTINVSAYDSFNLALLESILCGVPAFTNSHAGIAIDMQQWLASAVWDESDLTSRASTERLLSDVLTSVQYRRKIGEELRKKAVRRFGLSCNLQRVTRDFESLLAGDTV